MMRSRLFLLASVVVFALTVVVLRNFGGSMRSLMPVSVPGFGASALLAVAGVAQAVRRGSVWGGLANTLMALLGALAAYLSTWTFTRGRQLRAFGKVLLPPVRLGAAADQPAELSADVDAAEEVAAQWRDNARTEHASVAAFAHLTLDLMALGAPSSLIEGAQRDALDEVRHTELCFALAQRFDGRAARADAFPQARRHSMPQNRTLALARLAVDSLVDGALHEGVSARIIAALAKRSELPEVTAVLKEIAADEGRHAAHGWEVVRWCCQQGGEAVGSALLGAVDALPEQMRSPRPPAAADGSWERWGITGDALEAEQFALARARVIKRVRKLVGQAPKRLAA